MDWLRLYIGGPDQHSHALALRRPLSDRGAVPFIDCRSGGLPLRGLHNHPLQFVTRVLGKPITDVAADGQLEELNDLEACDMTQTASRLRFCIAVPGGVVIHRDNDLAAPDIQ